MKATLPVTVLALLVLATATPSQADQRGYPGDKRQELGSCGEVNSDRVIYTTREECRRRGGIFLANVQPYSNMFVVSACTHASTINQAQITVAVFRPKACCADQVASLASQHVDVLRDQGLITPRPVLTLRSNQDGTVLQILEWVPGGGTAAHSNPAVQAIWSQLAQAADFAPVGQLAERSCAFSSFALMAEE